MLTQKQKKVALEIFEGQLTEGEIIEQNKLSPRLMKKWLNSEQFQAELQRLCEASIRETRLVIARFGPIAAMRLAAMLEPDEKKPDVARKAALDMIDRCLGKTSAETNDDRDAACDITDEKARQMLLTLAKGMK